MWHDSSRTSRLEREERNRQGLGSRLAESCWRYHCWENFFASVALRRGLEETKSLPWRLEDGGKLHLLGVGKEAGGSTKGALQLCPGCQAMPRIRLLGGLPGILTAGSLSLHHCAKKHEDKINFKVKSAPVPAISAGLALQLPTPGAKLGAASRRLQGPATPGPPLSCGRHLGPISDKIRRRCLARSRFTVLCIHKASHHVCHAEAFA
jgi:hypothetical protein